MKELSEKDKMFTKKLNLNNQVSRNNVTLERLKKKKIEIQKHLSILSNEDIVKDIKNIVDEFQKYKNKGIEVIKKVENIGKNSNSKTLEKIIDMIYVDLDQKYETLKNKVDQKCEKLGLTFDEYKNVDFYKLENAYQDKILNQHLNNLNEEIIKLEILNKENLLEIKKIEELYPKEDKAKVLKKVN